MEDAEFSETSVLKFYIPKQVYFECEEKLSKLLDLQHGKNLMYAISLASSKPEYKMYYQRTILLASNNTQYEQDPI